jgi:general secretion pathway protein L
MLGAVALALPPQRAAAAVDYSNGELRLRGLALDPDETRAAASTLKAYGYNATASADALVVTSGTQP